MKKISWIIVFSLFLSSTMDAQFGRINRALERAVEKTVGEVLEKELEEAVEEAVEEAFDETKEGEEGQVEKRAEEPVSENGEEKAWEMEFEKSGAYVASYSFDFEYHLVTEEKGKENKMVFYLNESSDHTAIEMTGEQDEKSITLIDAKNRRNYHYTESGGRKSGIKLPFINLSKMMEKNKDKMDDMTITPLHQTKVVAGYSCEGFKMTSKDAISTIWITKEIPMNYMDVFSMGNQHLPNVYHEHPEIQGMMMEMSSHPPNKENKITTWTCTFFGKSQMELVNKDWGL